MANKQQVTVEMLTIISDIGDNEYYTVQAIGELYSSSSKDVLTYEESTDEEFKVKNMLTIADGEVSVKRSGPVSMHQKFLEQSVTENVYHHPHGHIYMETFTHSIFYERMTDEESGKLVIHYNVKLNGETERRHKLILTLQSKEDAA